MFNCGTKINGWFLNQLQVDGPIPKTVPMFGPIVRAANICFWISDNPNLCFSVFLVPWPGWVKHQVVSIFAGSFWKLQHLALRFASLRQLRLKSQWQMETWLQELGISTDVPSANQTWLAEKKQWWFSHCNLHLEGIVQHATWMTTGWQFYIIL
jgi:hypothetical protein